MNILFIGNSYTAFNDMPVLFAQLATANGKDVTVHTVTQGGRKLTSYQDGDDPITIDLKTLLNEQKFDVCFIQEQSVRPASDFDAFAEGVDCVINMARSKVDNFVLYSTWGRQVGSETLEKYQWTTESMTNILSEAYRKVAKLHDAQVSPAGDNFLHIKKNYPDINLYRKDLSHPNYLGSCLVALTHYYTIFHEFPAKTDLFFLSDRAIAAFKDAVCQPKA